MPKTSLAHLAVSKKFALLFYVPEVKPKEAIRHSEVRNIGFLIRMSKMFAKLQTLKFREFILLKRLAVTSTLPGVKFTSAGADLSFGNLAEELAGIG